MPDEVVTAMMAELRARHFAEDERRRRILLNTFRESRPQIERRLSELQQQKNVLASDEYLLKLFDISNDLWTIDSRRSAIMTFVFEFGQSCQSLETAKRLEIGTRLLEMCLEDDLPELANGWGKMLHESARTLPSDHPRVFLCFRTIVDWYIALCGYVQVKAAIIEALSASPNDTENLLLKAKLSEIEFLQGELRAVTLTPERNIQDD